MYCTYSRCCETRTQTRNDKMLWKFKLKLMVCNSAWSLTEKK
uniref:Uncharacterized protein n=1 Tax=Anguilla anguilla TaxID=7936 RepID=A0A0E9R2Y5_ANGAN